MHRGISKDEEDNEELVEIDQESGLRRSTQMEMNTLNQLNSLLKVEKPGRRRTHVMGASPHIDNFNVDGVEFNFRLIQEVRDRSFLYDVQAEAYNNPSWRVSAWADIGNILECTAEHAKTRWKTIRDKYKKEDKKVRGGDNTNWPYFDAMLFLQPHLKEKTVFVVRDTDFNNSQGWNIKNEQSMPKELEEEGPISKKNRIEEGIEESDRGDDDRQYNGGDNNETIQSNDIKRQYNQYSSYPSSSPSTPLISSSSTNQNEDEVFGHMIALKLSKMEPKMKEMVKVKLMQTLFDVQYGESPNPDNEIK